MSLSFDFVCNINIDGTIDIPKDVLGRLISKGINKLNVTLTSYSNDELLIKRGITNEVVIKVSEIQKYDIDIAKMILSAEGSVSDLEFENRLKMGYFKKIVFYYDIIFIFV